MHCPFVYVEFDPYSQSAFLIASQKFKGLCTQVESYSCPPSAKLGNLVGITAIADVYNKIVCCVAFCIIPKCPQVGSIGLHFGPLKRWGRTCMTLSIWHRTEMLPNFLFIYFFTFLAWHFWHTVGIQFCALPHFERFFAHSR